MARKSRRVPAKIGQWVEPIYQSALYVRNSVENERKLEADTVGTQIQMLKDFASQIPDMQIYDIYCDDDITGTTFIRPEFARMMNDVRDKKVNCIIVKDLSRLGRNHLESGEYLEKVFPFLGVRFIAINDRIDTLEKDVDLGAQLKNMANEMYARDISRKICTTMKSLQSQGKFIGSHPPYGYMRDPNDKYHLVIDLEPAKNVRRIFQMFLGGYTIHSIAMQLNEEGIPSPGRYKYEKSMVQQERYRKSVWFFTTTRRILEDPVYLGWIQNGKRESHFYKGGDKAVPVDKENWTVIKGMHEPIISAEQFNQVQEILSQNKPAAGRTNSKYNRDNILRGKLQCGECGKSMALKKRESHGKKQLWYFCPMHESYNSGYCVKKAVKKDKLEDMVLSILKNQMKLYIEAKELIRNLNKGSQASKKYAIYQEQIRSMRQKCEQYSKRKAELYQDYAEGLITDKEYLEIREDYAKKNDDLTIFLSEIQREAEKYAPDYYGDEYWETLIKEYRDQETLSRDMVEAFIDKIILFEDGRSEIILRHKDTLEEIICQAAARRKGGTL